MSAVPNAVWVSLAVGAVLFALAGWLAQRGVSHWLARRRMRRQTLRARRAEIAAPRWLEEQGYAVTAAQAAAAYALSVDGDEVLVQVRADYLVERDGQRYIAEVKSGQAAPSIRTRATRRQLLEYRMAFDVDGVLLVDAEAQRVHVVRFPNDFGRALAPPRSPSVAGFVAAFVCIVALSALIALVLR